jgi:hypothetical protein
MTDQIPAARAQSLQMPYQFYVAKRHISIFKFSFHPSFRYPVSFKTASDLKTIIRDSKLVEKLENISGISF